MRMSNRSPAAQEALETRGTSWRPAVLLVPAFLALVGTAEAAWYSPSWLYRKPLTLNGGLVSAAQTNFPVLLSFTDAQLGARAQASGNDILFTAADGTTKLNHEIESYTSPAGTLVAWVSVPALASPTNTTIYMYYGNAAAANQQTPTAVWDTSYKGVWHLDENAAGTGTVGLYQDSTSNAHHATDNISATLKTGQVGAGQDFDGANDYLLLANTGLVGAGWTVEAWIRPNAPGDFKRIFSQGSGASATQQLVVVWLQTGGGHVEVCRTTTGSNCDPQATGATGAITDDGSTWTHLVWTYNGTTDTLYLNGSPSSGTRVSNNLGMGGVVYAGRNNTGSNYWSGGLDELRVSSTARTATWIRTGYNNQANQGVGAGRFILALGPQQTTAVTLMSFAAVPGDRSVTLEWRTGSELDNLGFHLHRSTAEAGPYERITASLIPGLGSSPIGESYSYLDAGLAAGRRYHYRLEDIDTRSVSTFHGPVSAVAGVTAPPPPGGAGGGGEEGGGESGGSAGGEGRPEGPSVGQTDPCPSWVVSMHGAPGASSLSCTAYGDPESVSLSILSRDARSAELELRTGGFWVVLETDGTIRAYVRGFDMPVDPQALALPLRRARVEAVVGRKVRLASVEAFDLRRVPGLRPSAAGRLEIEASPDGTVRPVRRSPGASRLPPGYAPAALARLGGTVFQGEKKTAVLELTPLRYDGGSGDLVLARRVRVRLLFAGREPGETGAGSMGRRELIEAYREVLAQLHTARRGLHGLQFEAVFPGRVRGLPAAVLRLQRDGQAVPYRVEPKPELFGPGSVLYFHADREARSTDFTGEVAYELVRSGAGERMATVVGAPEGAVVTMPPVGLVFHEVNRIYQSGLLEAEDVWQWEALPSPSTRVKSFTLEGVDTGRSGRVVVYLQGASESGTAVDHHARVVVNGTEVGEASFAGKGPFRLVAPVPANVLKEGVNELQVENVGDTGVTSLFFLDRFEVLPPRKPQASEGSFEGGWGESGTAEVSGLSSPAVVMDVTADSGEPAPKWLTGVASTPTGVRFRAEAGHRYVVASHEGILQPRVVRPEASTLRGGENQADYLLIGPQGFLPAAEPLLSRRASEGLVTKAVSLEEIARVFGHGRTSGEAIRSFVSWAYHSWTKPSPRYVVLLGDATYDPRRFAPSTKLASPMPALWGKTGFLWTALDPVMGAVNGEDEIPDVAVGRIPASTLEQADSLIGKLLAWEGSGQGLGGKALLVADDPDEAGDFEWDVADIRASYLGGRETEVLKVGQLGAGTRPAIHAALDGGLSLLSYAGHGGSAVWASENVWNSWDAPSLRAQSQQPLLLTLNCLNGYFVGTNFDSLSESLVKAEGRGAIAAFSPSGLSVDGPAHAYHRALMGELVSGRHDRLGDAILAAQLTYAETGLMPELLSIYHLFGDPATRIR